MLVRCESHSQIKRWQSDLCYGAGILALILEFSFGMVAKCFATKRTGSKTVATQKLKPFRNQCVAGIALIYIAKSHEKLCSPHGALARNFQSEGIQRKILRHKSTAQLPRDGYEYEVEQI